MWFWKLLCYQNEHNVDLSLWNESFCLIYVIFWPRNVALFSKLTISLGGIHVCSGGEPYLRLIRPLMSTSKHWIDLINLRTRIYPESRTLSSLKCWSIIYLWLLQIWEIWKWKGWKRYLCTCVLGNELEPATLSIKNMTISFEVA